MLVRYTKAYSEKYRGMSIESDNLYGFSLIDTHENWACSMVSADRIKHQIDEIIRAENNDDFTPLQFEYSKYAKN